MPRAATAILAIACSTTYLSSDAGIIANAHASRCIAKSKRSRALSKRSLSKQPLISEFETSDKQDQAILASLTSWSLPDIEKFRTELELDSSTGADEAALTRVRDLLQGQLDLANLLESLPSGKSVLKYTAKGAIPSLNTLPEDLLLQSLEYVGFSGRSVCRAAQRLCDISLQEGLLLPTFPVKLCVKQHYHFNPEHPITTQWALDVVAPSSPCSLEVCTKSGSGGQEDIVKHQSSQSGVQVLAICRELRMLQASLGAHHKEDGRTSVEVVATDAAGRTLVDHTYERQTFSTKADDLLELLTESELHISSSFVQSSDDDLVQGIRARHAMGGRPVSRSH